VANRVGEENRGWYVAMDALSFERAGIGATIKYEQAIARLVEHIGTPEGRAQLRDGWERGARQEIARRYVEMRVLYNIARYSVSNPLPGYEASVNQLFSAELHQRLAPRARRCSAGTGCCGSAGAHRSAPTSPTCAGTPWPRRSSAARRRSSATSSPRGASASLVPRRIT